jgi:hypothetical protein
MEQSIDLWTYIKIYFIFENERLNAKIKITFHKALIRSVMTYACPAWEFAADTRLLKLQRLQSRVLRASDNFDSRTPVRELNESFKMPYVIDYMTKLCIKQVEVIQYHQNENVRGIRQKETIYRKSNRRNKTYWRSGMRPFRWPLLQIV